MLEAFLTPAKTSELRTLLQADTLTSQLRNQLLLSPSFHAAFRNGRIQLFPLAKTVEPWNDETEAEIKNATKVRVRDSTNLALCVITILTSD